MEALPPGFLQPSQTLSGLLADWNENNCNNNLTTQYTVMGHTMRTAEGWRFTRWVQWNQTSLKPMWDSKDFGEELYDYRGEALLGDFDMQSDNLAVDPANAALVQQLRSQLRSQFEATPAKSDDETVVHMSLQGAPLALPRKEQLHFQQQEIGCFFHFGSA